MDDPIHGFFATRLEDANGSVMTARGAYQLYVSYCADGGLSPTCRRPSGSS